MLATADFSALNIAAIATRAVLRHLAGQPVPKEIMVPAALIDRAQHRPMEGADGRAPLSRLGRDRAIIGRCASLALHRRCAACSRRPSPRRRRARRRRAAPASNQIDLNSASRDELMTLDGIGEVRADAIIRARPFRAKTELVERRLIPEALYEKIADKVFARAPPPAPPPPKPAPAAPPSAADADGRRDDLCARHADALARRVPARSRSFASAARARPTR